MLKNSRLKHHKPNTFLCIIPPAINHFRRSKLPLKTTSLFFKTTLTRHSALLANFAIEDPAAEEWAAGYKKHSGTTPENAIRPHASRTVNETDFVSPSDKPA